MPPLYPRMRERPPEFRINPESPLYYGLVFAGLYEGGYRGSMLYKDSSAYSNHGTLIAFNPATDWIFVPDLSRYALRFSPLRADYIRSSWPFPDARFAFTAWVQFGTVVVEYLFDVRPPSGTAYGYCQRDNSAGVLYANSGTCYVDGIATSTCSAMDWHCVCINGIRLYTPASVPVIHIGNRQAYPPNADRGLSRFLSDVLIHSRVLAVSEISALADPSNVDLRVGGVPLILPPRRRFWPVVSEQAIPKMVPWHLFQHIGV